MRILLLSFLFLGFATNLAGQKFLQIEKFGKLKVRKIPVGGSFYFQLDNEKQWYHGVIKDIHVSESILLFETFSIPVKNITAIKFSKRERHWARGVSNKLYMFAGAWVGFSLLGTLTGEPLTRTTVIVPSSAVVTGTLIRWIFRPRVFKIGKKRRLRVLDLSFKIHKPMYSP